MTVSDLICDIQTHDYRDLLQQLDSGSVDFILTDPPYAISKESGFSNGKLKKFKSYKTDFGEWDKTEVDLEAVAEETYRVLRQGGSIVIWYDLWKLTTLRSALKMAGFKMLRLIEWQKTNPVPINSNRFYLSNSREMAIAAVKGGGTDIQ